MLVALINSFNRCDLLDGCLSTLSAALSKLPIPTAILVYDAGSKDGSREFVKAFAAKSPVPLHLYEASKTEDTSFSAGLNTAAKEANKLYPQVKRYFIYETDNFISNPEAIPKAMKFMDEHADVAVVGFTCQKHAGHYTGSGDQFPTPWEFILSPPVVMRLRDKMGRGENTLREGKEWYWSDVVFSSPILVRREAWEKVGGFDPVNIPFAEADYDLAWRLRKHGWKEAILVLAGVIHDNRSVLSEWSQTRARRFHQARYQLMKMHSGRSVGWMKPFLFLRHAAEVSVLAVKAPFQDKGGKRLAARWKLLTSVFNGYN